MSSQLVVLAPEVIAATGTYFPVLYFSISRGLNYLNVASSTVPSDKDEDNEWPVARGPMSLFS